MDRNKRASRERGGDSREAPSAIAPRRGDQSGEGRPGSYWVTTQGHAVSVHEGGSAPSREPAEGEHTIAVEGPYPSLEIAERRASKLRSRSPLHRDTSKGGVR